MLKLESVLSSSLPIKRKMVNVPLPVVAVYCSTLLDSQMVQVTCGHDRGQTREICEKQENYSKGKVVTFTVQSLLVYQYPADLLTFLKLH